MKTPARDYVFNFRMARKWIEGDTKGLKDIQAEFDQLQQVKRKKKLTKMASNILTSKSLLLDLKMEVFKTHFFQNRNVNTRKKM